jgi:hypothetical protein
MQPTHLLSIMHHTQASLDNLVDDILLQIFQTLSAQEILTLRQVRSLRYAKPSQTPPDSSRTHPRPPNVTTSCLNCAASGMWRSALRYWPATFRPLALCVLSVLCLLQIWSIARCWLFPFRGVGHDPHLRLKLLFPVKREKESTRFCLSLVERRS